jgi:predicted amidohydrolase
MLVAAIQFRPTFKDIPSNLQRLVKLVAQTATKGAKIITLPELTTTGYSFMNQDDAEPFAEIVNDFNPQKVTASSMSVFHLLAKRYDTHIVWGLIEKDNGTKKLYNAQVLMCPDGSFEVMRKINFFGNDFLWATEGRANPPIRKIRVEGKTYKVGLLICRDVRDKKDDKWKDFYEEGDANVVCLSTNWGRGGFPAIAWMDFVKENKTALIVANRYGEEFNNDFGHGGVAIITAESKVYCESLVWGQDCVVYGEL